MADEGLNGVTGLLGTVIVLGMADRIINGRRQAPPQAAPKQVQQAPVRQVSSPRPFGFSASNAGSQLRMFPLFPKKA